MKKLCVGFIAIMLALVAGCKTEVPVYVQSTTQDAAIVKYYKQTLYNSYNLYEQENINLKAGTKLSDITKTYEHYVPKGFSQNGNVLSVFFDRQTYTLTFKADGKVFKTVSGIYESNVNLSGLGEPYSLKRHFNRWLGPDGNDAVFPSSFTEDLEYNAEMHDGIVITINYAGENIGTLAPTTVYCHTGLSANNVPVLNNIVSTETGEVTSYFNGWRLGSINGPVMAEGIKLDGNETSVTFYAKWSSQQYFGTKGPDEAREVGDIIFSDGSACPYNATLTDEQKSQAVAVIFYAGTESEHYYPYLGTTPRGVGINLTSETYSKVTVNAQGYTYLKNISLSCNNNTKGSLTFYDSVDSDLFDGLNVRNYLKTNFTDYPSQYPACAYCDDYNKDAAVFNKDWYLPSLAELDCLYSAKSIVNQAFISLGKGTMDYTLNASTGYGHVWAITNGGAVCVFSSNYNDISHSSAAEYAFGIIPIHHF
ncbi:MAG: hypothetical protein IKX23_11720 [Treponema sp.]|nr:hypothetical protein [Treponema sp.]